MSNHSLKQVTEPEISNASLDNLTQTLFIDLKAMGTRMPRDIYINGAPMPVLIKVLNRLGTKFVEDGAGNNYNPPIFIGNNPHGESINLQDYLDPETPEIPIKRLEKLAESTHKQLLSLGAKMPEEIYLAGEDSKSLGRLKVLIEGKFVGGNGSIKIPKIITGEKPGGYTVNLEYFRSDAITP